MGMNIARVDQLGAEINEMRMDMADTRALAAKVTAASLWLAAVSESFNEMREHLEHLEHLEAAGGLSTEERDEISDILDRVDAATENTDANPTQV